MSAAVAIAAAPTVSTTPNRGLPLRPPKSGLPRVAFVVGDGLVPIDLFGPQAVFADAAMGTADMHGLFDMYTVAESREPFEFYGIKAASDYTFDDAPAPHVLVVPMQHGAPATIEYIRHAAVHADVTASICTGAFLVAAAGLFDGGRATTHHDAYGTFARMYPQVQLIRGPRFVEDPKVSSSGGESSGIDLALRIVERYYGSQVAAAAAYNLEYRRTPRPSSISDV